MKHLSLHGWDVTPSEAIELQRELRHLIRLEPLRKKPRLVAGADLSFERFSDDVHAGFVVYDVEKRQIVARASATARASLPYIPGLLTFREGPALLRAWERLQVEPDVVVFDGTGIAHPRRLGVASHLGLFLDKPSIGCAKSLLVGSYGHLGDSPGERAPIIHRGDVVGYALRTRLRVKPVFASPGHRIDLEGAAEVLLACVAGYRIPEPTRQAHLYVNELRLAARAA